MSEAFRKAQDQRFDLFQFFFCHAEQLMQGKRPSSPWLSQQDQILAAMAPDLGSQIYRHIPHMLQRWFRILDDLYKGLFGQIQ